MTNVACIACGRRLKDPASQERGLGPKCWRRTQPGLRPRAPKPPARSCVDFPLPGFADLERRAVTAEEIHDLVDRLVDTDPLKLRDALFAVIAKLETLDGRSADSDAMLDELRETLRAQLA